MFTIKLTTVCFCALVLPPRVSVFFTRSIMGSSASTCSGVWDPRSIEYQSCNLQCCCSTEAETDFVPTSAQFFAASTFLMLRSPSWARSCIYRVSMCFVRCPAHNRSVKEIRRRTITLYFNFHGNSQILEHRSQGSSNLTSFHHCVKLRLPTLNAVKLWSVDPDFTVWFPV